MRRHRRRSVAPPRDCPARVRACELVRFHCFIADELGGQPRFVERRRAEIAGCLLLAQSRHDVAEFQCPLLGVKRTLVSHSAMSAFDPSQNHGLELINSNRFAIQEIAS